MSERFRWVVAPDGRWSYAIRDDRHELVVARTDSLAYAKMIIACLNLVGTLDALQGMLNDNPYDCGYVLDMDEDKK